MIPLERPLCVFDLEATGSEPAADRIVDICILRREPDGRETVLSELVNPGVPIPPEASAVHGITDAMVARAPSFKDLVPRLLGILSGADLSGFNVIKYDVPLLTAEFLRAGVEWRPAADAGIADSYLIFSRKEPRDLTAAYKFYCGKSLEGAHRAEADARAAAEVLFAQWERYADLPRDLPGLQAWSLKRKPTDSRIDEEGKFIWRHGEAFFAFGNKHKGKALKEVAKNEPSYLVWMSEKGNFKPDVVAICREALKGNFPRRA